MRVVAFKSALTTPGFTIWFMFNINFIRVHWFFQFEFLNPIMNFTCHILYEREVSIIKKRGKSDCVMAKAIQFPLNYSWPLTNLYPRNSTTPNTRPHMRGTITFHPLPFVGLPQLCNPNPIQNSFQFLNQHATADSINNFANDRIKGRISRNVVRTCF